MELFNEIDNVVKLGKWAYLKIPDGVRCGSCHILAREPAGKRHYYCQLRSSMSLSFDEDGPFKGNLCPVSQS